MDEPLPSINSSALNNVSVSDTARRDELFDHTGKEKKGLGSQHNFWPLVPGKGHTRILFGLFPILRGNPLKRWQHG